MSSQALSSNTDEKARVAALERYEILDTQPQPIYDRIAKVASLLCKVPISLISLIGAERLWFKSSLGIQVDEMARDISFCTYTIEGDEPLMEIPDTLQDDRFKNNPVVVNSPNIRFYAGVPITTKDGFKIGSLCILDYVPRKLTIEQRDGLMGLGQTIVELLEDHLRNIENNKQLNLSVRACNHKINNTLAVAMASLDINDGIQNDAKQIIRASLSSVSDQIAELSQFMRQSTFAFSTNDNLGLSGDDSLTTSKPSTKSRLKTSSTTSYHATAHEIDSKLSSLTLKPRSAPLDNKPSSINNRPKLIMLEVNRTVRIINT